MSGGKQFLFIQYSIEFFDMRRWVLRSIVLLASLLFLLVLVVAGLYAYMSTRTNGVITSSGERRTWLVFVPESYDPSSSTPLVISLHGAFLYPGSQMRISGWNTLADEEKFIVVYPKAAGFPATWRMKPGDELATEVQFFSDLIDELSADFNIDSTRIYLNGFSNGAAMTVMLACSLPDRIAAFGLVATPIVPGDWCKSSQPAPVIAIHGTDDPLALYEGGENFLTIEPLPSVRTWMAAWAERNLCKPDPEDLEIGTVVEVTQYSDCGDGASAVLYTINGAGHVWPGGMEFPGNIIGANSDALDATKVMWLFFLDHPLSPP